MLSSNIENWPLDSTISHSRFYNSLIDSDLIYYHKYRTIARLTKNIQEDNNAAEISKKYLLYKEASFSAIDEINRQCQEKYGKCLYRLEDTQLYAEVEDFWRQKNNAELLEVITSTFPEAMSECYETGSCDTLMYYSVPRFTVENVPYLRHECVKNDENDTDCDTRIIFGKTFSNPTTCLVHMWWTDDPDWAQVVFDNFQNTLSFRIVPLAIGGDPLEKEYELVYGLRLSNKPILVMIGIGNADWSQAWTEEHVGLYQDPMFCSETKGGEIPNID